MKMHFVSLPHTEVTREWEFCAYTQKLLHMGQICNLIGYETALYATEKDEGGFGEVVPVLTKEDQDKWFGHIDWNTEVFGGRDPESEWWRTMNHRSIEEIQKRIQPGDVKIGRASCRERV